MKPDLAMLGAPVHERADRDFYPTIDQDVTRALIDTLIRKGWLTKSDVVWECAAGAGDMSNVLEEYFPQVYSSDIVPQDPSYDTLDFLAQDPTVPLDAIITNPPFGALVSSFMKRGIEHIRSGRVHLSAMLARNELDCAKERTHLFKNCPEYAAKIVLTWRPRWIKGSTGSPRHQYAWYVWRKASYHSGEPALIYAVR